MEKLGIYNPHSGVTTNQSEGMNRIVQDLHDWKEAPVDMMVLSLFNLQTNFYNEIQHGLCGLGEYKLKNSCMHLACEVGDVQLLKSDCPEDIVKLLKRTDFNRYVFFMYS